MRNAIGTVTSHQVLSKESIPNTSTKIMEIIIIIRKKALSLTDHLPDFVFGFIFP